MKLSFVFFSLFLFFLLVDCRSHEDRGRISKHKKPYRKYRNYKKKKSYIPPLPKATDKKWVVVRVKDGDTIEVRDYSNALETRIIRFACIDTPEMAQKPYGEGSKVALRRMIDRGDVVILRNMLKGSGRDIYGRILAEVFPGDKNEYKKRIPIPYNYLMVKQGQAFTYKRMPTGCAKKPYLAAEAAAKSSLRGIWKAVRNGDLLEPKQYRRTNEGFWSKNKVTKRPRFRISSG
ncbi:hypothetical protein SNEBB_008204 [Seison nebaliae]|nr:hypothetical protein SNEBB_008204 [Seison nebaliae]